MPLITRTRIVIATLGVAGFLGAGAAVAAPAVMGQGARPGMQNQVVLTGMVDDGQPGMQQESQPGMENE
jgi:hypothetical protein